MDQYINAQLWNNYLNENYLSDISGATYYGTAGGAHSAIPAGHGTAATGSGAATTGGTGIKSAIPAPAGAGSASSGSGVDLWPEKKKIFFDVISKPIAIIGGSVIVLGLGYLLLKPKHKRQTSTAIQRA